MTSVALSDNIKNTMEKLGIDVGLSTRILDNYNSGKYDDIVPVEVTGVPVIDGKKIIDVTGKLEESYDYAKVRERIEKLGARIDIEKIGKRNEDKIVFGARELNELGVLLYPLLAYGVLNGGSASSYVDYKKNQSFNPVLFDICKKEFETVEAVSKGKAKGITPAFINADGSLGPSFLELKMRSLLIENLRYRALTKSGNTAPGPMFQMTSVYNNDEVTRAYAGYRNSPMLEDLIEETGFDVTKVETGIQPMLAALSHSSEGRLKGFFLKAHGKENNPLPMPGGHGQNFIYLAKVYRELYEKGKRFVYLGNVDNIGFTVDPVSLALLALGGNEAGFEFAFRTQVDVKGGVLIIDQKQRLNCADIGAAISKDEIKRIEKEGKKILFNVATGLFDLEYLVRNLEEIAHKLPMRISDQDKDSGKYAQAEQVTWEVIALLRDPVIFGVDKYKKFLASKLLLEGLMASGVGKGNPDYPKDPDPEKDLSGVGARLSEGLERQLSTTYGLEKAGNAWIPKSAKKIVRELEADPLFACSCI
jgi:UTP--glucose-1-phosphate uridylyltransferase